MWPYFMRNVQPLLFLQPWIQLQMDEPKFTLPTSYPFSSFCNLTVIFPLWMDTFWGLGFIWTHWYYYYTNWRYLQTNSNMNNFKKVKISSLIQGKSNTLSISSFSSIWFFSYLPYSFHLKEAWLFLQNKQYKVLLYLFSIFSIFTMYKNIRSVLGIYDF